MTSPTSHLTQRLTLGATLLILGFVACADTLFVSAYSLPSVDPTGLTNAIYRVAADGTVTTAYKGRVLPDGLAFDAQNRLFVANNGTGFINRVAGNTLFPFGAKITDPYGIAFDSAGNLFVASSALRKVYKITPNGTTTAFVTLSSPYGLAVDKADAVYVADAGASAIYMIAADGTKTTFAAGIGSPQCLAFDAAGNLFVSSLVGSIYKLTPAGTRSTFASGITMPLGLALDSNSNLYVASFDTGKITKITPSGVKSTFATIPKTTPKFMAMLLDSPKILGPISIRRGNGSTILFWDGSFTLQTSPAANDPFGDVTGATSPFTNQVAPATAFFRLRN